MNEETKIDSKHIDSNNQNSVAESENNTSNEIATNSEITAPNDTSLNVNDVQKTESINNDKKIGAAKTLEIEDNTKLEAPSQEDINDRNENAKLDTISDDKAANSDEQTSSNSVPTSSEAPSQNETTQSATTSEQNTLQKNEVSEPNKEETQMSSLENITSPKSTISTYTATNPNLEVANNENVGGKDVSDKITIVNSNIESNDTIRPHNGERSTLKYELTFDEGVKEGDYFDISLSNNVNTRGVSAISKVPEIKNGKTIIANGSILEDGKIRYRFTDYVNNRENIKANLSLNLFIDPKTVPRDSNQSIIATINGKETQKDVYVKYLNGINNVGLSVNGSIVSLNKQNNTFTHLAYINPNNFKIPAATVYGQIINGNKQDGNLPSVKVFKVLKPNELNQSVYADTSDTSMFQDVTNDINLNVTNGNYQIDFDNLDSVYVVKFDSTYDGDAQSLTFRTTLSGLSPYYKDYYSQASWDNGVLFYQNNADGEGSDPKPKPEPTPEPEPTPDPEQTPDPEPTPEPEPNIDPSSKDNEIQFSPNDRNNVVKLESQEDTNLNIKAINANTAVKSSQIATDTEAVNSLSKTNTSQHTNEKKQLPNTGEKERSTTMWSSFLLLLGSTLLFFRKKKQEEK